MPAARVSGTIRSKNPLKGAVEIIPERLYYAALKAPPPSHNILASTPRRNKKAAANLDGTGATAVAPTPTSEKKQIHFFNIDNELVYWNFFLDFGPLNLGQLRRFCDKLQEKLRKFPVVCYYSNTVPAKRANAIFLICAWQLLYMQRTPEQAYRGFDIVLQQQYPTPSDSGQEPRKGELTAMQAGSLPPVSTSQGAVTIAPLPPFHDASPCACTYDVTVLDTLHGMTKALQHGFIDWNNFDVNEYEYFEQVENGDLNWLVKDKILAFAGPSFERHISPEGYCTLAPGDYIPYFLKRNVNLVVRLNKKAYNEQDFVDAGINHVEAFFVDGSCPPMKVLRGVLDAFEAVPPGKAFAVHCKAGLGRTGTCIGAYLMKHYRLTATEVISWMRVCRPGCVIGPQQHFLRKLQPLMWQEGITEGLIERPMDMMTDPPLASRANGSSRVSASNNNIHSKDAIMTPTTPTRRDLKDSDTEMLPDDAVTGRVGQAEALLAVRSRRMKGNKNNHSDRQDVTDDEKDIEHEDDEPVEVKDDMPTPPVTPEPSSKESAMMACVVTPELGKPAQVW